MYVIMLVLPYTYCKPLSVCKHSLSISLCVSCYPDNIACPRGELPFRYCVEHFIYMCDNIM